MSSIQQKVKQLSFLPTAAKEAPLPKTPTESLYELPLDEATCRISTVDQQAAVYADQVQGYTTSSSNRVYINTPGVAGVSDVCEIYH